MFLEVGKNVYIQTVTYHMTGKIKAIEDSLVVLEQAAWIADTGRFTTAMRTGVFDEVELYCNDMAISKDAIVTIVQFPHKLPDAQI